MSIDGQGGAMGRTRLPFAAEGLASAAGVGRSGQFLLFPSPIHRFLTGTTRSWGRHGKPLGSSVPPVPHRAR